MLPLAVVSSAVLAAIWLRRLVSSTRACSLYFSAVSRQSVDWATIETVIVVNAMLNTTSTTMKTLVSVLKRDSPSRDRGRAAQVQRRKATPARGRQAAQAHKVPCGANANLYRELWILSTPGRGRVGFRAGNRPGTHVPTRRCPEIKAWSGSDVGRRSPPSSSSLPPIRL